MEPSIFDTSSAWSNLWYLSSIMLIAVWLLIGLVSAGAVIVIPMFLTIKLFRLSERIKRRREESGPDTEKLQQGSRNP